MTSQLPQELVNAIIDHVAHDPGSFARRQTLNACSLTCRAWLAHAQSHLFRSQWINSPAKHLLLLQTATDARLASYVRTLHIEPIVADREPASFGPWWLAPLRSFAQLRDVHLFNVVLAADVPFPFGIPAPAVSTSLTQLALWKFSAPTCRSVLALLHALPSLVHLQLERALWYHRGALCSDQVPPLEEPNIVLRRPLLRRLSVDSYCGYGIFECLVMHLDFSQLERLSLVLHKQIDEQSKHPVINASHPVLDQLLSIARPSLQSVWLETPDMLDALLFRNAKTKFSSSKGVKLPAIQDLIFRVDLLGIHTRFDWILCTLQDMDPSCLRTLTLILKVQCVPQLDYIDWGQLESVLLDASFKFFSTLVIGVPPSAYYGTDLNELALMPVSELQEVMEERLPTLVQQHTLRVETCTTTACTWNDLPI
ncbi:hypothetical protein EIP86_010149 [Pleurotus ostreatoroseus]|nr:hypothetical protein EIP86_010149 [Pleurotus ostreatoroseus]